MVRRDTTPPVALEELRDDDHVLEDRIRLHPALLEMHHEAVQLIDGDGFEYAIAETLGEPVENRLVLAIGVGLLERLNLVEIPIDQRPQRPARIDRRGWRRGFGHRDEPQLQPIDLVLLSPLDLKGLRYGRAARFASPDALVVPLNVVTAFEECLPIPFAGRVLGDRPHEPAAVALDALYDVDTSHAAIRIPRFGVGSRTDSMDTSA